MCYIEKQIAEYADSDSHLVCPMCHETALEEFSNMYGEWVECQNCNYESEQS